MKFLEFTFEDYLSTLEKDGTLHPQLQKSYDSFPDKIENFRNLIIYGPKGSGKYTQALASICKYSPTNLKYTRKFTITSNKNDYNFKMSDIHFEVDMYLLGCNAKQLWNDIYVHVIDILSSRSTSSTGIILCKNFQDIHGELLENFYSYMQKCQTSIQLRFLIVTEHISFLPDNIINSCYVVNVPVPSSALRNSVLTKKQKQLVDTISHIVPSNPGIISSIVPDKNFTINNECEESLEHDEDKQITSTSDNTKNKNSKDPNHDNNDTGDDVTPFDFESIMTPRKSNMKAEIIGLPSEVGDFSYAYCNELCKYIDNPKSMDFLRFRDVLYDMLIYDIKVTNVLWTILRYITVKYTLTEETYDKLMIDMYTFLQYYNNNYRPIYHLESYLFKIINTVHYSSNILDSTSSF
jgi:hypothetical protein